MVCSPGSAARHPGAPPGKSADSTGYAASSEVSSTRARCSRSSQRGSGSRGCRSAVTICFCIQPSRAVRVGLIRVVEAMGGTGQGAWSLSPEWIGPTEGYRACCRSVLRRRLRQYGYTSSPTASTPAPFAALSGPVATIPPSTSSAARTKNAGTSG